MCLARSENAVTEIEYIGPDVAERAHHVARFIRPRAGAQPDALPFYRRINGFDPSNQERHARRPWIEEQIDPAAAQYLLRPSQPDAGDSVRLEVAAAEEDSHVEHRVLLDAVWSGHH